MKRQYVRPYGKKDGTEVDEYDRSDAVRRYRFVCPECGEQFVSEEGLLAHVCGGIEDFI